MAKFDHKHVCLLVNLGGFEARIDENLKMARNYGQTVYSLTGDGLVLVEDRLQLPVNVMDLTPAELFVWSSMINEQLQMNEFQSEDVVIFAAGRNYRGTLPLGTAIGQGLRIGA
jgi:hypothetical protein